VGRQPQRLPWLGIVNVPGALETSERRSKACGLFIEALDQGLGWQRAPKKKKGERRQIALVESEHPRRGSIHCCCPILEAHDQPTDVLSQGATASMIGPRNVLRDRCAFSDASRFRSATRFATCHECVRSKIEQTAARTGKKFPSGIAKSTPWRTEEILAHDRDA
jgi:hypothetical protein